MFVYNFKFDKKKIAKILFIFILVIITLYFLISAYMLYKNTFKVRDENQNEISNLKVSNYTNVLKSVHENLDEYIGKEICFSGYVYRVDDLDEDEFVLARDMIINEYNQTVVVGFLCKCKNANEYLNNEWIEITGKITKGDYHGEMPIIKITDIKKIDKPQANIYVYPPDNNYVPTVNML